MTSVLIFDLAVTGSCEGASGVEDSFSSLGLYRFRCCTWLCKWFCFRLQQ